MPISRLRHVIGLLFLAVAFAAFFFVGRYKLGAWHYNRGCSLYESGRYEDALASFRNSSLLNPTESSVYFMLGQAHLAKGQISQAESFYFKVIAMEPEDPKAYEELSYIYLGQDRYQEALDILRKVPAPAASSEAMKQLVDQTSLFAAMYYADKGMNAFHAGEHDKAYAMIRQSTSFLPDFNYAHYAHAYFDSALGKDGLAEKRLNRMLQADSSFFPAKKLLGNIYFKKRLYQKTVEMYKEVIEAGGADAALYNDTGIALNRLESYDDAARYLKKAAELAPFDADIRYSLACNYRDKNDFSSALAEYGRVLKMRPDYPNIYNDLGDIYITQGRGEESLLAYKKEVELARKRLKARPEDPEALNNLAYALKGAGSYEEADRLIEKAIALSPDHGQLYFTSALIKKKQGRFQEADAALEKAGRFFREASFIKTNMSAVRQEAAAFRDRLIADSQTARAAMHFAVVTLHNGRQMKGRIRKEDAKKLVLEVRAGESIGLVTFLKDEVEKIDRVASLECPVE